MCKRGFKYSVLVKSTNVEKVIVFIRQLQGNGDNEEMTFPAEKGSH